jgi:ATP-dependent DNA helicase RecG
VIPLRFVNLGYYADNFISWLEIGENSASHLSEGLKQIELPAAYFELTWQQVLLLLVPSWHQKGTQLLKKKNWYLIGILSLCSLPIALSDLMVAFDYKNTKTFRDNYLKPLREAGLVVFTIPEKPTDPDNKYVLTQQGKAFLGGNFK